MAELKPLPEEVTHNWIGAYEHRHGGAFPSRRWGAQFDKWIENGTMTHELIVSVMEEGLKNMVPNLLGWMHTVLAGCVPYGVRTPEERKQYLKEQAAAEAKRAQDIASERKRVKESAQDAAARKPKAPPKTGPVDDTARRLLALQGGETNGVQ